MSRVISLVSASVRIRKETVMVDEVELLMLS